VTLFVDGNVNYPSCRCTPECEMPCWQLYGLTDKPCGACGCAPFEFKPAVVSKGAVSGQEAEPQEPT
jgi:hypothetical protein